MSELSRRYLILSPLASYFHKTMLIIVVLSVNPRLRDLVLQTENHKDRPVPQKAPMETPWTDVLTERGFYTPDSDSSSEDDLIIG